MSETRETILVVDDDREIVGAIAAALEKELQALYGESLGIYRSEPYFIEIVPRGVDKGSSLAMLAEHMGMAREDVICCGDGFNDIPMLRCAGLGVAMGNAPPQVQAAADAVSAPYDQDGAALAIEQYVL